MKKRLALILAIVFVLALALSACGAPASSTPAATDDSAAAPVPATGVTLTLGNWRPDDVAQLTAFLAIYKEKTGVEIKYQPTNPPDYNATLRTQLESGIGPDVFYSRSFATGQELFKAGFVQDVSDIAALKANFTQTNLSPWQTDDGIQYAVPFGAVSHAVYYNKTIFKENGIEIPTTYEDFIAACEKLKAAKITPLANGVADQWDILETFFLGMLPNYVGGAENRVKYETGEVKFTDKAFVNAFSDISKVKSFLPVGYESVTYNDSQTLFQTGGAAMFVDGSWTLGVYGDPGFEWSVFALPARKGETTNITLHPDAAIAMNKASKYPAEAKAFLEWVASEEGAQAAASTLPVGIFPMNNSKVSFDLPQANDFIALINGKTTDARFVWPKLMELYAPMNQAVIDTISGKITAEQAAKVVDDEAAKLIKK